MFKYKKSHLYFLYLLFPIIFDFIINLLMDDFLDTPLYDFFYKGGFLFIYFFYLIFFLIQIRKMFYKSIFLSKLEYFLLIIIIFFIFYNVLSILLVIFNDNPIKYFFSDITRGTIFFITLGSLIIYFSDKTTVEKLKFINLFIGVLFLTTFMQAIAKINLLLHGTIYGGGLNQYMINIAVLFILFWKAFKSKQLLVKTTMSFFIILGILLTILSLKRGSWIELIIFFILFYFTLSIKRKIIYIVVLTIISMIAIYILNDMGFLDVIMNRFTNTYSHSTLDVSSLGRIVEIKGVLYTLTNLGNLFITGAGNGALFSLNPDYIIPQSSLYGNANSPIHHIHPMYFMVLFRLGIIGLICYIIPTLIAIRIYFYLIKHKSLLLKVDNEYIFIFGVAIAFLSDSIQFLKSNGLYGSFYFAILFFVMILGYQLIKQGKLNEN